jgi:hypothetical protein
MPTAPTGPGRGAKLVDRPGRCSARGAYGPGGAHAPMKTLVLTTLMALCLVASPALARPETKSEPAAYSLAPSLAASMAETEVARAVGWLMAIALAVAALCVAFRAARRIATRRATRRCP